MNQFYWRGLACTGVAGRDRFRRTKSPPKSPSNLISTVVLFGTTLLRGAESKSLVIATVLDQHIDKLLVNYPNSHGSYASVTGRAIHGLLQVIRCLAKQPHVICEGDTLGQIEVSAGMKDRLEE